MCVGRADLQVVEQPAISHTCATSARRYAARAAGLARWQYTRSVFSGSSVAAERIAAGASGAVASCILSIYSRGPNQQSCHVRNSGIILYYQRENKFTFFRCAQSNSIICPCASRAMILLINRMENCKNRARQQRMCGNRAGSHCNIDANNKRFSKLSISLGFDRAAKKTLIIVC